MHKPRVTTPLTIQVKYMHDKMPSMPSNKHGGTCSTFREATRASSPEVFDRSHAAAAPPHLTLPLPLPPPKKKTNTSHVAKGPTGWKACAIIKWTPWPGRKIRVPATPWISANGYEFNWVVPFSGHQIGQGIYVHQPCRRVFPMKFSLFHLPLAPHRSG